MEVILEYAVDVVQVGVGPHAFQAILITKFVNRETTVGIAAYGEVISIVPLLTHWKSADRSLADGRVLVVCSHKIRKFREAVLCHILERGEGRGG